MEFKLKIKQKLSRSTPLDGTKNLLAMNLGMQDPALNFKLKVGSMKNNNLPT
jgi:hypothetical protein